MQSVMAQQTLTKQPSESLIFQFNFNSAMTPGEVINVIDDLSASTFPDADDLILTDQTIESNVVKVRIDGGSHGYTYRVRCLVTTNAGNIRELDGRLFVNDGS